MSASLNEFSQQREIQEIKSKPLDSLLRLGNFFELDFDCIPANEIKQQLELLENNWVQYNPYKPHIPRRALSITSLDGGVSGKPDLYSLREFYRKEGTLYRESDFRTPTPYYNHFPSLKKVLDYFSPHLGRTHILRFDTGGYFPPHRDAALMNEPDTFRLIVPLTNITNSSFVFLYGNEKLALETGTVYFLNTLINHSVFSFTDNATMLVCNIILNHESVRLVKSKLAQH